MWVQNYVYKFVTHFVSQYADFHRVEDTACKLLINYDFPANCLNSWFGKLTRLT